MNIVEQAWMSKWEQVQGMYREKLCKLGTYGETAGFSDVLYSVQSASSDEAATAQVSATAGASAAQAADVGTTNSSTAKSSAKYDELIAKASQKYSVPESLIKAVIRTESNFNKNAVSSCGAQGLMQLMPGTASGLGVTDAFDPEQNIDGGTRYLAGLLNRYQGDVRLALTAYNRGPGNVGKISSGTSAEELWDNLSEKAKGYANTVLKYAQGY